MKSAFYNHPNGVVGWDIFAVPCITLNVYHFGTYVTKKGFALSLSHAFVLPNLFLAAQILPKFCTKCCINHFGVFGQNVLQDYFGQKLAAVNSQLSNSNEAFPAPPTLKCRYLYNAKLCQKKRLP